MSKFFIQELGFESTKMMLKIGPKSLLKYLKKGHKCISITNRRALSTVGETETDAIANMTALFFFFFLDKKYM